MSDKEKFLKNQSKQWRPEMKFRGQTQFSDPHLPPTNTENFRYVFTHQVGKVRFYDLFSR